METTGGLSRMESGGALRIVIVRVAAPGWVRTLGHPQAHPPYTAPGRPKYNGSNVLGAARRVRENVVPHLLLPRSRPGRSKQCRASVLMDKNGAEKYQ